ncbi:MAG: helix-turn-helix domain-containing protein, partial [Propionibacteriaceae bacterium]
LLAETTGYRVLRPSGTTDWLLIHTLAGRGRFGRRDGADVLAPAGTVTLLSPGTPHDYGVEEELQEWEIGFSHFHARPEWQLLLDWPQVAPGVAQIQLDAAVDERIRVAWRTLAYWSRSEQQRSDLFGMNALELILLWCDTQNARAVPLDARILRVLEHLDQNLTEPLTVRALADIAQLSVSRFAHLFSAQLGMSPSAYLERQRISQARLLLEHTQRPVAEIARSVGFSDPLYFSTRFRRVVGTAPTHYRQHAKGEPS